VARPAPTDNVGDICCQSRRRADRKRRESASRSRFPVHFREAARTPASSAPCSPLARGVM
jgi:hypothetical protein